jgi:ribonuclease P protein component
MRMSLKNKKDINNLFTASATNKMVGNCIVKTHEGTPGYLVTVSSKVFKRAVDRNRIKRLIRNELKGLTPTKSIGIIYIGKELPKEISLRKYLSER